VRYKDATWGLMHERLLAKPAPAHQVNHGSIGMPLHGLFFSLHTLLISNVVGGDLGVFTMPLGAQSLEPSDPAHLDIYRRAVANSFQTVLHLIQARVSRRQTPEPGLRQKVEAMASYLGTLEAKYKAPATDLLIADLLRRL